MVLFKLSLLSASLLSGHVQAEEAAPTLGTITVKGEAPQESASVGSRTVVTQEKIQTFDNFGMSNAYQAISLEPGVDVRYNDPTGTNASYKIRGNSSRGHALILEGLPFKGIGIGQSISDVADMENIATITIEKGAIPASGNFGFGHLIDMRFMRPAGQFSTTAKQIFGSNDFTKTFVRLDTGELGGGIKGFVSGSLTETDKFKGVGTSLDRDNLAFGLTGGAPNGVEWEVFGIYNGEKRDLYKGLTYAQSTDPDSNWKRDYNPAKTGVASQDIAYYAYNREDYRVSTILGKLKVPFGQDAALTFRPYFLNDRGNAYGGSGQTMVNFVQKQNVIVESLLDHNTFGAVLEYEKKWKDSRLNIGYWHGEHEPPGPPTARKARDTDLNFIGWVNLYGVGNRHSFDVPYVAYSQSFDKTVVDAGLKHLSLTTAEYISYNTTGIGDVGYAQAKAQAGGVDFTLPSNTYTVWLPSIGATRHLNEAASIKASYGRNYDMPEIGWASSAISYFKTLGYDEQRLQNLWATRVRPQESDDLDLDYRYASDRLAFTSSLYYKRLKYISTGIYDPTVNLTYSQNSGEGRSYGLEFGSSYQASNKLSVNLALSYNNTAFTSDVQTGVSTTVAAKGKQLPDRPKVYGNVSAVYDLNGYKIAPVVRYLGSRYADVLNQYSVDATWLADLSVSKDVVMGGGHTLRFSLSAMNLFDEKYIATISTSDVNTTQTGPTYLVGAPRSVFASAQYTF
jgi:iron complex outermembrane receptor protein